MDTVRAGAAGRRRLRELMAGIISEKPLLTEVSWRIRAFHSPRVQRGPLRQDNLPVSARQAQLFGEPAEEEARLQSPPACARPCEDSAQQRGLFYEPADDFKLQSWLEVWVDLGNTATAAELEPPEETVFQVIREVTTSRATKTLLARTGMPFREMEALLDRIGFLLEVYGNITGRTR